MRFIQYSRKSSEGDERQIQSIPDQNSALDRLVLQQNLSVVKNLEESRSAKTPNGRPLFTLMIKMIMDGEADGILCWHLNRLSRNPVDSGQLSWMLQQGLIKCIKTPEREYRPEDNVVIMAVENAVANQYIIDLRKNIARGQDEKAARGWYPYRPPAGYLTNPVTREIDIDPKRYPLIRRAWELMLTGSYLVPEVLEKLEEWGYRTHKGPRALGQSIGRSRLYQLFDSPFYYGEFMYRGERIMGKHQPMVTREEFERVQVIIHRKSYIRPQRHSFAFTGLIRCGGCGCLVTAERKVKHYRSTNRTVTYVYYRCTRSKPCSEPCVTEAYIVQRLQEELDRLRLDPDVIDWAEGAILNDSKENANWTTNLNQTYQTNIAGLESKLSRLLELRLNGEISAADYQLAKQKYQKELDETKRALERLAHSKQAAEQAVRDMFGFIRELPESLAEAPEKTQRQVATYLAEAYVLTLGKLEIRLNPLLREWGALEPPKSGSQRVRKSKAVSSNPQLCSRIESIRTLLETGDVSFEPLSWPG